MVCEGRDHHHCVLDAGCDSREVLALLSDKWAVVSLYALARGTRRYNHLHREIGGVSQKMLTPRPCVVWSATA